MGDAEGVASYVTVNVPVWLANAVFCQALPLAVTQVCGAVTTSVTVAVCVVLPLVPVMVSVELPAAAELLVVMVSSHARARLCPHGRSHSHNPCYHMTQLREDVIAYKRARFATRLPVARRSRLTLPFH